MDREDGQGTNTMGTDGVQNNHDSWSQGGAPNPPPHQNQNQNQGAPNFDKPPQGQPNQGWGQPNQGWGQPNQAGNQGWGPQGQPNQGWGPQGQPNQGWGQTGPQGQPNQGQPNQGWGYQAPPGWGQQGYQQGYGAAAGNDDNVMCAIGYLGILVLVPILAIKDKSPFAKAHINSALSLTIQSIIVSVGIWVINMIIGLFAIGVVGSIMTGLVAVVVGLAGLAVSIAILVIAIMNLIKAAKGEYPSVKFFKVFDIIK
jgi:uncharacterized Tic20 family protein